MPAQDQLGTPSADVQQMINDAAQANGLSPKLLQTVMQTESNYNLGIKDGGAGEIGPMQLTPGTRKTLGITDQQARDPRTNINMGAKWLRQNIDQQGGNIWQGVRAYNGSGSKAQKYAQDTLGRLGDPQPGDPNFMWAKLPGNKWARFPKGATPDQIRKIMAARGQQGAGPQQAPATQPSIGGNAVTGPLQAPGVAKPDIPVGGEAKLAAQGLSPTNQIQFGRIAHDLVYGDKSDMAQALGVPAGQSVNAYVAKHGAETVKGMAAGLWQTVKDVGMSTPETFGSVVQKDYIDPIKREGDIADAALEAHQYGRALIHYIAGSADIIPGMGSMISGPSETAISGKPLAGITEAATQLAVGHVAGKYGPDVVRAAAKPLGKALEVGGEAAASQLERMSAKQYNRAAGINLPESGLTKQDWLDAASPMREAKMIAGMKTQLSKLSDILRDVQQRGRNVIIDAMRAGRTADSLQSLDDSVRIGKQLTRNRTEWDAVDEWKKRQSTVFNRQTGQYDPIDLQKSSPGVLYRQIRDLQQVADSSQPEYIKRAAKEYADRLTAHLDSVAPGAAKALADEVKLQTAIKSARVKMNDRLRGAGRSLLHIWGSPTSLGVYFIAHALDAGWWGSIVPAMAAKLIADATISRTIKGATYQWMAEGIRRGLGIDLTTGKPSPGTGYTFGPPGLPPGPRGGGGGGGGGGSPTSGGGPPPGGGGGGAPVAPSTVVSTNPPRAAGANTVVRAAQAASKLLPPHASVAQVVEAGQTLQAAADLQRASDAMWERLKTDKDRALRSGTSKYPQGPPVISKGAWQNPWQGPQEEPAASLMERKGTPSQWTNPYQPKAPAGPPGKPVEKVTPNRPPREPSPPDPRLTPQAVRQYVEEQRAGRVSQRTQEQVSKAIQTTAKAAARTPEEAQARAEWMRQVMEQHPQAVPTYRGEGFSGWNALIDSNIDLLREAGPLAAKAAENVEEHARKMQWSPKEEMKALETQLNLFTEHPDVASSKEGL